MLNQDRLAKNNLSEVAVGFFKPRKRNNRNVYYDRITELKKQVYIWASKTQAALIFYFDKQYFWTTIGAAGPKLLIIVPLQCR